MKSSLRDDVRDRIVAASDDRRQRVVLRGASIVPVVTPGSFIGDVMIRDGQIEAVGEGLAEAASDAIIVDASRHIVIPGLIDSHVHAWEGQLRGLAPDAEISNYVALTHAGFAQHYLPEDLAVAERLTAAQALNAGTTTIVDNSHNTRTRAHADAAIEALLHSGIRAVYAPASAQVGEHENPLPADLFRLREQYAVNGGSLVTLRMYDDHPSVQSWRFAAENDFDICVELGHWTPDVEGLARSGLMRQGHTYNHCAGLSPDVWSAIADSGAAINLCPRSDTQFGLGAFAPILEANRHGIQEGISSDNELAYAHDLFTEMRVLLTIQRGLRLQQEQAGAAGIPKRYAAADALRAATVGGSHNAGLSGRIGTIEPGVRADLVLLSLDDVTTSLSGSVVGTVVNFGGIANVDAVFVDGNLRKWAGELVGIDYPALVREGERSRERLFRAFGTNADEARSGIIRSVDRSRADSTMASFIDRPGQN